MPLITNTINDFNSERFEYHNRILYANAFDNEPIVLQSPDGRFQFHHENVKSKKRYEDRYVTPEESKRKRFSNYLLARAMEVPKDEEMNHDNQSESSFVKAMGSINTTIKLFPASTEANPTPTKANKKKELEANAVNNDDVSHHHIRQQLTERNTPEHSLAEHKFKVMLDFEEMSRSYNSINNATTIPTLKEEMTNEPSQIQVIASYTVKDEKVKIKKEECIENKDDPFAEAEPKP